VTKDFPKGAGMARVPTSHRHRVVTNSDQSDRDKTGNQSYTWPPHLSVADLLLAEDQYYCILKGRRFEIRRARRVGVCERMHLLKA